MKIDSVPFAKKDDDPKVPRTGVPESDKYTPIKVSVVGMVRVSVILYQPFPQDSKEDDTPVAEDPF
jgi:hypothetical protein